MATSYHTEKQAGRTVLAGGLLLLLGIGVTIPSTDVQTGLLLAAVGGTVAGSVNLVTKQLGENRIGTLLMYGFGVISPALWMIDFGHDGKLLLTVLSATLTITLVALASHLRFKTTYGLALGFGSGAVVSTVILYGV